MSASGAHLYALTADKKQLIVHYSTVVLHPPSISSVLARRLRQSVAGANPVSLTTVPEAPSTDATSISVSRNVPASDSKGNSSASTGARDVSEDARGLSIEVETSVRVSAGAQIGVLTGSTHTAHANKCTPIELSRLDSAEDSSHISRSSSPGASRSSSNERPSVGSRSPLTPRSPARKGHSDHGWSMLGQ